MRRSIAVIVAAILIRNGVMTWAAYATPNYTMRGDYLSELAALGAPYRLVVSILGPGLTGFALLVAGPALWTLWRGTRAERASVGFLMLAGLAYLGIALAPCDPGCSTASMNPRMAIHLASGLLAMSGLLFAGAAMGVGLLRSRHPSLAWAMLITAVAGLAAFGVLAGLGPAPEAPGLVQRLTQLAGDLSVLGIAFASWRRTTVSVHPPGLVGPTV